MTTPSLLLFIALLLLPLQINAKPSENSVAHYKQRIAEAEESRNLQEVISTYRQFLKEYDDIGGKANEKPLVRFKYAMMLTYAGEYEESINLLTAIIGEIESLPEHQETLARSFMQLGMIHFFMEQFDEALSHFVRAEQLAERIDSKLGLSIAKNNIGNIYQKREEYATAISYYEETLELQKEVNDSATICNAIFNIGSCYEVIGREDIALMQFQRAYEIANNIGDEEIKALSMMHIGVISKNAALIEQSIGIVEKSGHRQVLIRAYKVYAKIRAEEGNYEIAYETAQKSLALSDSLFKEKSLKELNDSAIKYKTKEIEAETRLQRVIFMSVGALLVLVIAFLIHTIIFHRRANAKLRDINARRNKLFSIISHDIKNPLIAQKNVLEMIAPNVEHIPTKDIKQTMSDLLSSARSLLDLLYNLLDWSKIEGKTITYNPIQLDIRSIIREVIDLLSLSLSQKEIEVNVSTPDKTIAYGDVKMLATVIRNLLTNAIKYSHSNSIINITVEEEKQKWRISIADNGIGMSEGVKSSLFKITSTESALGTKGETGTGLGLIITKELVSKNGGKTTIDSTEGKGTTIAFTIKKSI